MAHQQPPPQQYNGGGRGRGNNGGRGSNNGGYNPHMAGNYPPNMNYGGRGGGGNGGVPQQIGAWQPAPAASGGYPNLSRPPAGANPQPPPPQQQQQLQSPPVTVGGIQSPPLNSSLQQANRTPNLKPAPPHAYGGGVTSQPPGAGNPHSQRQPPPNFNPYNNPYGVPNQYGYPPQHRQQQQQQQQQHWQEQQMPYAPNNPYAAGGGGGNHMRNPAAGPPMYYSNMAPSGSIMNGPAAENSAATPSSVVVPPAPKKIPTITDKDGNVIDFSKLRSGKKASSLAAAAASVTPSSAAPSASVPVTPAATTTTAQTAKSSDAGSKMLQLARARLEGKDIKSTDEIGKSADKKDVEVTSESAKADADTETPVVKVCADEAPENLSATAASTVNIVTPKEGPEQILEATVDSTATTALNHVAAKTSSLQEQLNKATDEVPVERDVSLAPTEKVDTVLSEFLVYPKDFLLRLQNLPVCMERPEDLPAMEIVPMMEVRGGGDRSRPGPAGGGASGRRNSSQRNVDGGGGNNAGSTGGGDQWARGNTAPPRRQSSQTDRPPVASPADQWSRGQAPPKQQGQPPNAKGGGRGGRGSFANNQMYDDDVEPLVKSENHWRPQKNTSALIVAEKKVKAILNKMTKEKFDRLSEQMLEIPLLSYETLNMMINYVYEKAIDEPAFGDLYANLCVRLSEIASDNKFVHIIESDEEPPTDDGQVTTSVASEQLDDIEGTSRNKVYRWSHDVSTTDAEIIGPLTSEAECINAAFEENARTPTPRGEMELELVNVTIKRGILIKTMKKLAVASDTEDAFYVVFFPVSEAEECGQQISEIFLSEVECKSDASKKNSFKRSLLNKCEEEFNKKDIYDSWQKEKLQYEDMKSKLTDQERAIQESELNFRRIKIKKQMLGNVKFIGQLYKVNLLREKVMRFCIGSMLKLEERKDIKSKNPEYEDTGNTDMDEEDHEAICNMFATIGSTIDKPPAAEFMKVCFQKIERLSQDQNLPSRSKFMYKDLIDLRSNNWIPRRKEEKAKTIAEIREDVEAEERRQAQLSAQLNARGNKNDPRNSGRNDHYQRQTSIGGAANRPRIVKPLVRTDDDGFTTVAGTGRSAGPAIISPIKAKDSMMLIKPNNAATTAAPLNNADLERKIKGMRADYMGSNGSATELLLTWDEISNTPTAGLELVKKHVEYMMDCKDIEREAIYNIIRELCERGKLTKADVQDGLVDAIEFIDDLAVDCPRAHEFLGALIGDMLRIKMFDIGWLCNQCEKTKAADSSSLASEKLFRSALYQWKKLASSDVVKSQIQHYDSRIRELIGDSTLQTIINEVLIA